MPMPNSDSAPEGTAGDRHLAPLPTPSWNTLPARPVRNIRACLFLLLNVDPSHALANGWHKPTSEHPVARSYERLLRATLHQVLLKNPLLVPLYGQPTRQRSKFQLLMVSLADFICLVDSPYSPYATEIEAVPEGLRRLRVQPAFDRSPPAVRLSEMAKQYGNTPQPAAGCGVEGAEDIVSKQDVMSEESPWSAKTERLECILGAMLVLLEDGRLPESMRKSKGQLNIAAMVEALEDTAKRLNGGKRPYAFGKTQLHERLSDALHAVRHGHFYVPKKATR